LPVKIILDANFLMVPAQFGVDIFEGITTLLNRKPEPIILTPTYRELQKLAASKHPKRRLEARLALELAEKCRMVKAEPSADETVDDLIIRLAEKWKCPVATNDRELRKKLKKKVVPVVFLRQKTRLECG